MVATPFPLSYRQPWSPSVTQRPLSYPRPVTPLGLVYTLGLGSLAPLGQLREEERNNFSSPSFVDEETETRRGQVPSSR